MLSAQQALALIATGVSQRQIAALLGISYRTAGRWLRVGFPEGAKRIPDYALPAIANLARTFRDAARAQALADGLPFSEMFPVMAYRPINVPENAGEKDVQNLRMFVDNTQYMHPDLRRQVFATFWVTREFIRASVGSLINWLKYVETRALTYNEEMRIRYLESQGKTTPALFHPNISQYDKINLLERQNIIRPIWTKGVETQSGIFNDEWSFDHLFYSEIENRLRERHQPNAVVYANRFLFQLATEKFKAEKEQNRRNTQTPYKKVWNDSRGKRRNKRGK